MVYLHICKFCKKEFTSKMKNRVHCSKDCYTSWLKTKWDGRKRIKNCIYCNKEFLSSKTSLAKFCSRACRSNFCKEKNTEPCSFCGKEFVVFPYKKKRTNKQYCSEKCQQQSQTTRIIRTCKICGKEFTIKKSAVEKGFGIYCSRSCKHKGMENRVTKVCLYCEKEFKTPLGLINNNRGIYCSKECKYAHLAILERGAGNPNWNNGSSMNPYCYKFNNRRKKACRDLFNNMCICSGESANDLIINLCVHHVYHDKEEGCEGKPFNLVPLNSYHHRKEQHNKKEYQDYINKTLREGFKWGIWNEQEYIEKVMYPE